MVSKSQIALVNKTLNQKYQNKTGYVKPEEGNLNNTQYFFLYSYADVLAKIKSGISKLDITSIIPIDNFEINNFANSQNNTGILDSIQGYAIGNDKTIYLSSQLGPSDNLGKLELVDASLIFNGSLPKIAILPWHKPKQIRIYPIVLKHEELQQWLATQYKNYQMRTAFPECEGIQLQQDSLLLSVTWHTYLKSALSMNYHTIDMDVIYQIGLQ